jgi:hypothetical protein
MAEDTAEQRHRRYQERSEHLDRQQRWAATAATWVRKAVAVLRDEPSGYHSAELLCQLIDAADTIVKGKLPDDYAESWEFEYTLAYAEAVVAALSGMAANASLEARIAKLEEVTGRTPEEAELFRRKAAELRARLLSGPRPRNGGDHDEG